MQLSAGRLLLGKERESPLLVKHVGIVLHQVTGWQVGQWGSAVGRHRLHQHGVK